MTPEHPFQEAELKDELLGVCDRFVAAHADLGALVLECTVMSPFAHLLNARFAMPVFDITTLAGFVAGGLRRAAFAHSPARALSNLL
jgi:hypothetical protein